MKLAELTREQKIELKQTVLTRLADGRGEGVSMEELSEADERVTDTELELLFKDTDFSEDDFFCSHVDESK